MHARSHCRVDVAVLLVLFFATAGHIVVAHAQSATSLSGRLLHSLTKEPVPDAVVAVEELKQEAKSNPDGTYRFDNLPAGTYHLTVRINGFVPKREEITIPATGLVRDL